jgi:hypothetical protein
VREITKHKLQRRVQIPKSKLKVVGTTKQAEVLESLSLEI